MELRKQYPNGRPVSEVAMPAFKVRNVRQNRRGKRVRFAVDQKKVNPLMEIHLKYGHLSEGRIKLAYKKQLITDSKYKYDDIKDLKLPFCPDCMRGRMKAFSKEQTTDHPWKKFQKIAMDYKGPFKRKSLAGYNGFYLFSVTSPTMYGHIL